MPETIALILAAGKGKRMKSDRPKVLHELCGRPMVSYVIDNARKVGCRRIILVIGHLWEQIKERFANDRVEFVLQEKQLGTGHAVMQAEELLTGFEGEVLVLCGDMPLVSAQTLENLLLEHRRSRAAATVLTVELEDPAKYGRIVRGEDRQVEKIVEYVDATSREREIKEVNTAAYCFNAQSLFHSLRKLSSDNLQGEYYLTDVIELLKKGEEKVSAYKCPRPEEGMGINSEKELLSTERVMREILSAGG
jgi:bifunctional UDP-N-acetylglucosamine pyrophosphorylase/glucosamine-1-phosphate N-acetyltransferase